MGERPVVLVSNRGPLRYDVDADGALVARRGAGGLVSGLAPLMAGSDRTWIAAAMSDGDRAAAATGVRRDSGLQVQLLTLDPTTFDAAYDEVCNATIWYLHHHLFDLTRAPSFDQRWFDAWDAYRTINADFAEAIASTAPHGAVVLVQDYHLCLVPSMLREQRPDVAVVHFSHTPFAAPEILAVLPDGPRRELLEGLSAADACGFHSERWAASLRACCAADAIDAPRTFVAPLATDADDLRAVATSPACDDALARLDAQLDGRQLIARVDRVEPSKNVLRGFAAFDRMLELHPDLRGTVVLGAWLYPSREGVAAYRSLRADVEAAIAAINERWAHDGWTPVLADLHDDFPTSVAALRRYDVLLVHPVRDGLNLVATEGPLVNERDGELLLSPQAGAWDLLSSVATAAHPFDLEQTAHALASALQRAPEERATRAAALRAVAEARTPADWFADQLAAAPGGAPAT